MIQQTYHINKSYSSKLVKYSYYSYYNNNINISYYIYKEVIKTECNINDNILFFIGMLLRKVTH